MLAVLRFSVVPSTVRRCSLSTGTTGAKAAERRLVSMTAPSPSTREPLPLSLSLPVGISSDAPTFIVIQEWWGMNEQMGELANELGEKAKVQTVIPDLYRGVEAKDAQEASHQMDNLDWMGAIEDIANVATWLKKEAGVSKVATVGFCMGGALSLAAGVHHPGVLDGAIAFYGAPPAELADVSTIRIPVQAHFGEVDPLEGFSDAAACERLKEQLAKAAVSHDVYTYPGMGHAFMNTSKELRDAAGVTEPYSPEVVSLAYSRVVSFARTHLHASEDSD